MGALVLAQRLMLAVVDTLGRLAAGGPPRCSDPGCTRLGHLADLDAGPGGLCEIHGGES